MKRRFDTRSLAITVLASSLLLGGCGLLQSVGLLPKPSAEVPLSEQSYQLVLELSAASDVNPDAGARPSPVRTLVFLTEPDVDVAAKPYESLFGVATADIDPKPDATLVMQPGGQNAIVLSGMKSQTRLSVAAAFREPYRTRWITSRIITPDDTMRASVAINALYVEIGDIE